jgi:hypothetical protein
VIAGVATLGLVWRRRYEPARYLAAVAVAATIAGWAVAQNPVFLQGSRFARQRPGATHWLPSSSRSSPAACCSSLRLRSSFG